MRHPPREAVPAVRRTRMPRAAPNDAAFNGHGRVFFAQTGRNRPRSSPTRMTGESKKPHQYSETARDRAVRSRTYKQEVARSSRAPPISNCLVIGGFSSLLKLGTEPFVGARKGVVPISELTSKTPVSKTGDSRFEVLGAPLRQREARVGKSAAHAHFRARRA